jgi:hypothetical protein
MYRLLSKQQCKDFHCISTALGIVSNLQMIACIQRGCVYAVYKYHTTLYKALELPKVLVSTSVLESILFGFLNNVTIN